MLSNTPRYLPKGVESLHPHGNLHAMFIVSLFIIILTWKQLSCPSGSEWINASYLQVAEDYAELKRNLCTSL